MKETSEFKEMSLEEMLRKDNHLRQELFNLRFQHATNQLENTEKLRIVKRSIARISTFIRQKSTQQ